MVLPEGLIAYHHRGGRMEGDLGETRPGWFQLWALGDIESLNTSYEVQKNLPGFTGIGSNGGGELLAVSPTGRVVAIPSIGMEAKEAVVVAESWDALEKHIGAHVA